MKKTATAHWVGDLKTGKGTLSTGSGALKSLPYSFATRFENAQGCNPEELIGAAHAGCFTMACCAMLTKGGFVPSSLSTEAQVQLSQVGEGWEIDEIRLNLKAKIPNITPEAFQEIATNAKNNCPVSKLFKAKILLEASLLSE